MKTQDLCQLLNMIETLSPGTAAALVQNRVFCTEALAESDLPLVIGGEVGRSTLGMLGLLNGLLTADGQPKLVQSVDEVTGAHLGFCVK